MRPILLGLGALGLVCLSTLTWADTRTDEKIRNFPIDPPEAEQRLAFEPFEILKGKRTQGGVMGAKRLLIRFPRDGLETHIKWKTAPRRKAEGWNNSPRNEVVAYVVQRLFLDPADYVVPTTVARCIPLDDFAVVEADVEPTLRDTHCVFGAISLWLENVTMPENVYEAERFANDPVYAFHVANMNLFSRLILQQDGRQNNFLVSVDESNRRVFSIDNGVSLGTFVHNWFAKNWGGKIRVPAVPPESVARLRALSASALDELAVLAQFEADEHGVLVPVAPSENWGPKKGTRVRPGGIQFGLRLKEIARMRQRLEQILEDVDTGKIPLLPARAERQP